MAGATARQTKVVGEAGTTARKIIPHINAIQQIKTSPIHKKITRFLIKHNSSCDNQYIRFYNKCETIL